MLVADGATGVHGHATVHGSRACERLLVLLRRVGGRSSHRSLRKRLVACATTSSHVTIHGWRAGEMLLSCRRRGRVGGGRRHGSLRLRLVGGGATSVRRRIGGLRAMPGKRAICTAVDLVEPSLQLQRIAMQAWGIQLAIEMDVCKAWSLRQDEGPSRTGMASRYFAECGFGMVCLAFSLTTPSSAPWERGFGQCRNPSASGQ